MNEKKKLFVNIMCGEAYGVSVLDYKIPKKLTPEMKEFLSEEKSRIGLREIVCVKNNDKFLVGFNCEIENHDDHIVTLIFETEETLYLEIESFFGEAQDLYKVKKGIEGLVLIKKIIEKEEPKLLIENQFKII